MIKKTTFRSEIYNILKTNICNYNFLYILMFFYIWSKSVCFNSMKKMNVTPSGFLRLI